MTDSFDSITPEFENEQEEFYFALAVLGEKAHEFWVSDVGKYVKGRAFEKASKARKELATVSPWRKRRIQYLQNEIKVAESILIYVQEVISDADLALQQLKNMRSQQ